MKNQKNYEVIRFEELWDNNKAMIKYASQWDDFFKKQ